jgi:hypothetical protein
MADRNLPAVADAIARVLFMFNRGLLDSNLSLPSGNTAANTGQSVKEYTLRPKRPVEKGYDIGKAMISSAGVVSAKRKLLNLARACKREETCENLFENCSVGHPG